MTENSSWMAMACSSPVESYIWTHNSHNPCPYSLWFLRVLGHPSRIELTWSLYECLRGMAVPPWLLGDGNNKDDKPRAARSRSERLALEPGSLRNLLLHSSGSDEDLKKPTHPVRLLRGRLLGQQKFHGLDYFIVNCHAHPVGNERRGGLH